MPNALVCTVMRSASETALPVRSVPVDASPLSGLDALLATLQMPRDVPVATVAVGKAGAAKAGVLAAQIIATGNPDVAARLKPYKAILAAQGERAADVLQRRLQGP